jgi:hypothetical protein
MTDSRDTNGRGLIGFGIDDEAAVESSRGSFNLRKRTRECAGCA